MVECHLAKVKVASSNLVSRSSSLPGQLHSVSGVSLRLLAENCITLPRRSLQIEAKLALRFVKGKGRVKSIREF